MNIPIKVDRDFELNMKHLARKYGEDFELLNGFHESQINFSDFIDGFIDKNVADVTIDANANASHKDVKSLQSEKTKSHDKLFGFSKIFYELKKWYGLRTARKWLITEYNGGFYLHDAASSTFTPYSYKGSETVLVKYKDSNPLLINFSDLYDLVEEEPVLLNKVHKAYCKYTDDLIVRDSEGWVKVSRVIKKPRTNRFHFVKTENGLTEIVTDNHPLITKTRGDVIAARALENEDILTTYAPDTDFGNNTELFVVNHYSVNYDFGWITGLILSEKGSSDENLITITNKNGLDLNRVRGTLGKLSVVYSTSEDNSSVLVNDTTFCHLIYDNFIVKGTAYDKHLNPDILKYNKDFINGLLAGLRHDNNDDNEEIHVDIESRNLVEQVSHLARMLGYSTYEQNPSIYFKLHAVSEHRYVYHLTINKFNEQTYSDSVLKTNVELSDIYEVDEYVYDITTETGHFICNGILSHNCYAYDLTKLAEEGLFFLHNYNNQPPKHLTTFLDDVIEYISFMSNRSSGAVGIPNVLIWTYYFWKKDCENGYYIKNPDYYIRQCFQKFIYRLNQPFMRRSCAYTQ